LETRKVVNGGRFSGHCQTAGDPIMAEIGVEKYIRVIEIAICQEKKKKDDKDRR
jgi:hypothetical protein